MMKRLNVSIILSFVAISQHLAAEQDQIRLVTAPNNEYTLEWKPPAGPLRVLSADKKSAGTELDLSSFGQRFGEDAPTAVPLTFVSPDSAWLLVVAPEGLFVNAPQSFDQPALLFHR